MREDEYLRVCALVVSSIATASVQTRKGEESQTKKGRRMRRGRGRGEGKGEGGSEGGRRESVKGGW